MCLCFYVNKGLEVLLLTKPSTMQRQSAQQSKSAPALRNQVGVKKSDTLREVKMWIESGQDDTGPKRDVVGRSTGMLTENVTEERMLLARQMELGRERYKFLSNHMYEKQKFLDRQARKQRSMTVQMLRAKKEIEKLASPRRSITVVMPRVDDAAINNSDVEDNGRNSRTSRKQPRSESRCSKISRLSRACSNRSPTGKPSHLLNRERMRKTTNKSCYINSSMTAQGKGIRPETKSTSPSLSFNQRREDSKGQAFGRLASRARTVLPFGRQTHNERGTSRESTAVPNNRTGSSPIVNDIQNQDGSYAKRWAVKTNKNHVQNVHFGSRFQSSVSDPRYVALTRSLIPHETLPKPKLRVEDIISSKDLLSKKGSKCEQNTQRKLMHANFIAYILAELNLK